MGLGERVRRWLDPPVDPEPEVPIVVAVVAFSDGPMYASMLEGAGIHCMLREGSPWPGRVPDRQHVIVLQRDRAAAEQLIADLHSMEVPPDLDPDLGPEPELGP
jgi:hypothetical protein